MDARSGDPAEENGDQGDAAQRDSEREVSETTEHRRPTRPASCCRKDAKVSHRKLYL